MEEFWPEIYEFQRLPFGNAASPFCAQYVLQSHGQTLSEEKSKVAETVDNSMYVVIGRGFQITKVAFKRNVGHRGRSN